MTEPPTFRKVNVAIADSKRKLLNITVIIFNCLKRLNHIKCKVFLCPKEIRRTVFVNLNFYQSDSGAENADKLLFKQAGNISAGTVNTNNFNRSRLAKNPINDNIAANRAKTETHGFPWFFIHQSVAFRHIFKSCYCTFNPVNILISSHWRTKFLTNVVLNCNNIGYCRFRHMNPVFQRERPSRISAKASLNSLPLPFSRSSSPCCIEALNSSSDIESMSMERGPLISKGILPSCATWKKASLIKSEVVSPILRRLATAVSLMSTGILARTTTLSVLINFLQPVWLNCSHKKTTQATNNKVCKISIHSVGGKHLCPDLIEKSPAAASTAVPQRNLQRNFGTELGEAKKGAACIFGLEDTEILKGIKVWFPTKLPIGFSLPRSANVFGMNSYAVILCKNVWKLKTRKNCVGIGSS